MNGPADPYLIGLRLLSKRELSTRGLADRLHRRGFASPDIEQALERLRRDGALDDARAARSFADTFLRRGRGKRRVLRDVEAQGIAPHLAEHVVSELFADIDEAALMREIAMRRCAGPIRDRAELERLHRFLIRRGFPSDAALALLRTLRVPPTRSTG